MDTIKKFVGSLVLGVLLAVLVLPVAPIHATTSFWIDNPYQGGTAYKGQLHCHSQNSDGGLSPADLATQYDDAGYDFLAITDHDYLTPDPGNTDLLFITGLENSPGVSPGVVHMTCLNISYDVTSTTNQEAADKTLADGGLASFAHPNYPNSWTTDNLNDVTNVPLLEIYNYLGGTDNQAGEWDWDYALTHPYLRKIWGTGGDDYHGSGSFVGFDKGYVVVFAENLTLDSIIQSLKLGNFYASSGVTLSIIVAGDTITATSDNVCTFTWKKEGNAVLKTESSATSSSYTVTGDEQFVRVVASSGIKNAWSQPLFIYPYHQTLLFQASTLSTVTDFPISVSLNSTNFDFTKALGDGNDIKFTDADNTTLFHEIEWWDNTTSSTRTWVKVPQIDGGSTTDYINMYWGGAHQVIFPTNKQNVWGGYSTINICETTNNWSVSSGGSLSLNATSPIWGVYSIQNLASSPTTSTNYTFTYNPSDNIDLSGDGVDINLWLNSSRVSTAYTSSRLYIYDTSGNWDYWDLVFSAGTWTNFICPLGISDNQSGTPPTLTSVDNITISFETADTTPFTVNVDRIEKRWGAVGVWHFSEMVGTNAGDSTRYANNMTLTNGATWDNYCLSLDGSDDFAITTNSYGWDYDLSSYNFWMYPTNLSARHTIFDNNYTSLCPILETGIGWGTQVNGVQINSPGAWWVGTDNNSVSVNTWNQVCFTNDSVNQWMFTNGDNHTLGAPSVSTFAKTSTLKIIGKRGVLNNNYFQGTIDEGRIYNNALSANEVKADYMNLADTLLLYGDLPPSVATVSAVALTSANIILSGNITNIGAGTVTNRGFQWGLATGDYTSNWTESGSFETGDFSHQIEGLTEGITYYFRALATNTYGTSYGSELNFTTMALVLWYQPTSIISGDTLPDEAGNTQDGTIVWGTLPTGITISIGGITGYESTTSTAAVTTTDVVGSYEAPSGWFATGTFGGILTDELKESFRNAAEGNPAIPGDTGMGMETRSLYLMIMFGVAVAIGLSVLLFTGSTIAVILVVLAVLSFGSSAGIIDMALVVIVGILSFTTFYLVKQH